jgi:hypothetical protein
MVMAHSLQSMPEILKRNGAAPVDESRDVAADIGMFLGNKNG